VILSAAVSSLDLFVFALDHLACLALRLDDSETDVTAQGPPHIALLVAAGQRAPLLVHACRSNALLDRPLWIFLSRPPSPHHSAVLLRHQLRAAFGEAWFLGKPLSKTPTPPSCPPTANKRYASPSFAPARPFHMCARPHHRTFGASEWWARAASLASTGSSCSPSASLSPQRRCSRVSLVTWPRDGDRTFRCGSGTRPRSVAEISAVRSSRLVISSSC
jgi:hypothetical protein